MARSNRKPSKGKKINPKFWVFCEGETEKAYVRLLRSIYRLPIEIKSAGDDINEGYIRKYKWGKPTHKKDQDFLIYDADVEVILNRLKKIRGVKLLASNPSIELWFLLHYKNHSSHITTENCIRELSNRKRNVYKKGTLDEKLIDKLISKRQEAVRRAKRTSLYENPSTNIYEFIEILEQVNSEKL